jgi:predicted O-linked N-acetylglucosamine transferase (SPINDLY family)
VEPQDFDALMQRLTTVLERQDHQLERLSTLQAIANERLEGQAQQLGLVLARLDRHDATQAGMSQTLVRLTTVLEQQTQVLDRLETTLQRMIPQTENGRDA